jgi:hypothetical protein
MPDGSNIIPLKTSREVAKLASLRPAPVVDHPVRNSFGWPPVEEAPSITLDCTEPPPRFDIRGYVDGWQIFDRGELIVTVRGPRFEFASKILRQLREDAEREPPPFQPAA